MQRSPHLSRSRTWRALSTVALSLLFGTPCLATPFLFSTGDPDGRMATASQPTAAGIEIESADDFVLAAQTVLSAAAFTGLLPSGLSLANISEVVVEIYRVFPLDSTDPPSGNVPTRLNSPSDVAFDSRDSASAGELAYSATLVNQSFTALNSVVDGIHKKPNQTTLGEGAVTGEEVRIDVDFTTPLTLPAGHYFFVPQVLLSGTTGNFLWLSAPKPIVAPGTPFLPDLQSWIRNEDLAPDWLRIGTDIVGGDTPPTFNAAFALVGEAVPEPSTLPLLALGCLALGWRLARRR